MILKISLKNNHNYNNHKKYFIVKCYLAVNGIALEYII
jgi:hypothetical protein